MFAIAFLILLPRRIQMERQARAILVRATQFLKPGGTIVYSTCSIESEENEDVIEKFCEANPDYKLRSQRSLFPPDDKVDGAFVAKLAHQS